MGVVLRGRLGGCGRRRWHDVGGGDGGDAADGLERRTAAATAAAAEFWGQEEHSSRVSGITGSSIKHLQYK